ASCLELFRRAVQLKLDEAWEVLLTSCVGAELRGRLLSHRAWPRARRYQPGDTYLTEAFARFCAWSETQASANRPVRLESFSGLLTFLHRCLHSAILEELRIWAPPGTWGKKVKTAEPAARSSPPEFEHWPSPAPMPREPESRSDPSEETLNREVLRALWACA